LVLGQTVSECLDGLNAAVAYQNPCRRTKFNVALF
jgi:hypothetical protein